MFWIAIEDALQICPRGIEIVSMQFQDSEPEVSFNLFGRKGNGLCELLSRLLQVL
jgi:hypothetical protein